MQSADQVLRVIWRRRISFVIAFVWVIAGVAVATYSLPKTYSTSAYLLVSTLHPTTGAYEAQQVSQVDTQTVASLLQTRNAADLVASRLAYSATGKDLLSKVAISPVANTQLVLITASESTPVQAQELANTYAGTFAQQAASTIVSATVKVAEPAALITDPSGPRIKLYLLIGAFLALLAGAGAALLREQLDQSLKIEDFATELLGLPILAQVPELRSRRLPVGRHAKDAFHDASFVEGFRMVFANLAFASLGNRPATITVISAREREGKSTVCVALAQAAADRMPGSVLLVDADLRRPTLGNRLDVDNSARGLSTYLTSTEHDDDDSLFELVWEIPDVHVRLVPAGPVPPNPSSLLGLPALEQFTRSAGRLFDFVIYDTPPVGAGADASLVAASTDAAILIVDAHVSRRASVEWALAQLRRADVNVIGVIINRVSDPGLLAYYDRGGGKRSKRAAADAKRSAGRAGAGTKPVRGGPEHDEGAAESGKGAPTVSPA